MKTSPIAVLSLVAASALVLTGCGTTEDTAETESGASTISVVDARGETIELDGPATKVVALEWNAAESLVSLGVMPAGIADVAGYGDYVQAAPLDDTVTDVGMRGEPSVDAIAGLAPDLVVVTNDLAETAIAQIEEIAPVLVLRGADASDSIGQMEKNLNDIATLTGSEDEAEKLLADLDATIAEGKAALEEAGLDGTAFALNDAYAYNGAITIRPFYQGAVLTDVAEQLGLVSAWEGEGDENYGLGETDVEALTALPADVKYLVLGSQEGTVYSNELAANPIWTALPFVQSGDVYTLTDGIWPFGGPASIALFVDSVVDSLTS
jgi:ABC-type Fe3+-hydroxamate transport system substrate-binding protein